MPETPLRPAAYSMAAAAEQLAISRQYLYTLVNQGKIRRVKLGRRSLIPATEIDRLLQVRQVAG